jgi:hypothetical protein
MQTSGALPAPAPTATMAPMSDAKQAWEEVGSKFSGLGQRLKQHLDQERQGGEATGEQANRDVKAALEKLTSALDDAFDALGRAAKDPAVRDDVSDAGRSLVGALGTSLEQLGDEVRRLKERKKRGDAGGGAEAGTTPSDPPPPGSLNDTPEDGGTPPA